MTLTLASPFSYPLHVASWRRPAGSIDYRVTNTFTGPDFLNGGMHRAVDVGNFRRGDAVKAPATCRARGLRHSDGALGVRFDLGSGVVLELWHLDRVELLADRWTPVSVGQVVGVTGATGARMPDGSAMPAHTHIALFRNRLPIDPEPHLPMVERAAKPIALEDDMQIRGKFLHHVVNREARLTVRSYFRSGVLAGADAPIGDPLPEGSLFRPVVAVEGRAAGTAADRAVWYGGIKTAGVSGEVFGYVHSSVLPRTRDGSAVAFSAIERADCSAVEAELARERTKISRARTSAQGAAQAATATVEALR